jgi:hypothetical protein
MDDDDVLEKEDLYIFRRLREFLNADDVKHMPAAKQCLSWIERAVRQPVLLLAPI